MSGFSADAGQTEVINRIKIPGRSKVVKTIRLLCTDSPAYLFPDQSRIALLGSFRGRGSEADRKRIPQTTKKLPTPAMRSFPADASLTALIFYAPGQAMSMKRWIGKVAPTGCPIMARYLPRFGRTNARRA
jgi:hypothetical protein